MGRTYKRRTKGQTQKQKAALKAVNAARREKPADATDATASGSNDAATLDSRVDNLCAEVCRCKKEAAEMKKKYWNEYRRAYRMEQRAQKQEDALARANREVAELEEQIARINNQYESLKDTSDAIQDLQRQIESLEEDQIVLHAEHRLLEKLQRGTTAKEVLRNHMQEQKWLYVRMGKRLRLVQLRRLERAMYKRQKRRKVRKYLISVGVDEKEVGNAIARFATFLGVDI